VTQSWPPGVPRGPGLDGSPQGSEPPPHTGWHAAGHGQSWLPAAQPPAPSVQPGQAQGPLPLWAPQSGQWPAQMPASAQYGRGGGQPLPGAPQHGQVTGKPWPPSQNPPSPSALPTEPRQYHEFLRTPSMRWWRPIAAIAMGAALWFLATVIFSLPAILYDTATGVTTWRDYSSVANLKMTPALFLANNLAVASAIPIAYLTQWACFGQRPRWLASVTGGFRWGWCAECVAWLLPVFLIHLVLETLVGGLPVLQVNANTVFMIAAILLTTPLQSAGEEYLLRGLGQRSVAAWLPRTAGLVVSTAVTAVIFMFLHGAGDPWLNTFYLVFAVTASVLVWRTGGLEAAVALHAVNNVSAMVLLPFSDFSDVFNRTAGVGSPWMTIPMATLLLSAALVLWRAKRRGVITMAAPAAPAIQPPPAPQHYSPPATGVDAYWRHDHGDHTVIR